MKTSTMDIFQDITSLWMYQ